MIAREPITAPRFPAIKLILFLILAFALSWYAWVLALLRHATSGPNPLGLLVAALMVLALNTGGPHDLLLALVRVREAPTRWLAALLMPVGFVAAARACAAAL